MAAGGPVGYGSAGMGRFDDAYAGTPPWDIGRPQPAIVRLADAGAIAGAVLDAGCGTGENALYLASRGHEVWGVDFTAAAVALALEKARARGIAATFLQGDALRLDSLGRTFDTAIDCGLFHAFADEERPRYVLSLAAAVRPGGAVHLLCFSEEERSEGGPRRVTRDEIRRAFSSGWTVESIEPDRFDSLIHAGGARAWRALLRHAGRP
jgi:cyclopropane fatty-acyl-phospholipid synthase-like methyltransferase